MKKNLKRVCLLVIALLTLSACLIHFVLPTHEYPMLHLVRGDFCLLANNGKIYNKEVIESELEELQDLYYQSLNKQVWNRPATWLNPLLVNQRRKQMCIGFDYANDALFEDLHRALVFTSTRGMEDYKLKSRKGLYLPFFLAGHQGTDDMFAAPAYHFTDVLNDSVQVPPHSRVLLPDSKVSVTQIAAVMEKVAGIKCLMIEIRDDEEELGGFLFCGKIEDWN